MLLNCGAGEDFWESLGQQGSNQSVLKEISPEYSLKGLLLKLKLQCFGHLMQKSWLIGKTLMLGKLEAKRRRGQQRMIWLDSITDSMDINLRKLWEIGKDTGAWCAVVHIVTKSQTWLSDWTKTTTTVGWFLKIIVLCTWKGADAIIFFCKPHHLS